VAKKEVAKLVAKEEQANQEKVEEVENIKIIKFNTINNFILII
jgi:hypothetical protein